MVIVRAVSMLQPVGLGTGLVLGKKQRWRVMESAVR